jgi:tetratricopeptide (TPR) repeat protein
MKPLAWMGCLLVVLGLAGPVARADTDRATALRELASETARTRQLGVVHLAETGEMTDVPALLSALDDEDATVRAGSERAIWAIWSRSGDTEVDRLFTEGADHLAHRRLPESVEVFTRIIERKPDFAEGWNKRATALYLAGDMDASAADCDEVLKRNPSHFGALSGYGLISLQRGNPEAAVGYFERALALNPNMPGVRANIEAIRAVLARRGRRET